ncbi:hypothetical protein ES288_1Z030200v1 [Gossypium darwinii]|uniref:Uncharacterized protein n=1 Tax=Gossypium darwinii TaxID=34276 RepID=A0A5C7J0G7_GOSDA|nr:hypothetical protein ES288_1Z030200v1 [Gossypium darwinii]
MKLVADKRPNGTTGRCPLGDTPLNGGHPKRAIPAYGHNKSTTSYFSICGKCIVDAYLEDCSKFVDSYCGELFYFIM